MTLYIVRKKDSQFEVIFELNSRRVKLNHIYVYAMEFGVFPDVKFIEFYGEEPDSGIFVFEKITIS